MPNQPRLARGRPSNREAVLASALAVVRDRGAGRLTIEAVAKHSGSTKGGVMYHFPSKEALIAALVDRARAVAEEEIASAERLAADTGCSMLSAYVEVVLSGDPSADPLNSGIIGAAANEPALLGPFRELMEDRFRRLCADGASPARVGVVLAALDGIWTAEALGIPPFSEEVRTHVAAELSALAGEAGR